MATRVLAAERPLRVAMLWNGALHQEELLAEPRSVTLGTNGKTMFPLPEGVLGDDDFMTLLAATGSSYALQPNPRLSGFVSIGGQRQDARALRDVQRLGPDDYGVVTLGSVALFFQHVPRAEHARPVRDHGDPALLACLGLSIFLQQYAAQHAGRGVDNIVVCVGHVIDAIPSAACGAPFKPA